MFLVGFFPAVYGWRLADGKRTQWLGFLILRKTERTAEFVEGKGELEWKRLCVYSSSGRSMARGSAEARLPLSFSVSFTESSLFIASFFIIIYNKRILNGVVTLPNNTMYRFFKLYVSEF